jgi:hypothetical protein
LRSSGSKHEQAQVGQVQVHGLAGAAFGYSEGWRSALVHCAAAAIARPYGHERTFPAALQDWVGRTETVGDDITAAPLRALAATLDRDDPPPQTGTALPPLWHWLYFLPTHAASEIGPDGHAKRGGFLPPVPLPRRMWAAAGCSGRARTRCA